MQRSRWFFTPIVKFTELLHTETSKHMSLFSFLHETKQIMIFFEIMMILKTESYQGYGKYLTSSLSLPQVC